MMLKRVKSLPANAHKTGESTILVNGWSVSQFINRDTGSIYEMAQRGKQTKYYILVPDYED